MTETTKKRPSHVIYTVNGDGPGAEWIEIGVAFPHKDGLGLSLLVKEQPKPGRLALRNVLAKTAKPDSTPDDQPQLPIRRPAVQLPDPLRRQA